MNHYEEYAKDKLGITDPDFHVFLYEAIPKDGSSERMLKLVGCVASTRKYAKTIDWTDKIPGSERELISSFEDYDAWVLEWGIKNGKCHVCGGTGQQLAGCSVKNGPRYKTCKQCNGTGEPNNKDGKTHDA